MLDKLNPNAIVAAGLVAFAIATGALLTLYGLAPNKPDVAPLFAGIPGAIAALVTMAMVAVQKSHGAQLKTIGKNTNGVLTQRITEAVNNAVPLAVATALASHNVVAVVPTSAVPSQPTAPDVETTTAAA